MNAVILSLLIKSFCMGYIKHEHGNHRFSNNPETIQEIQWDYRSCIDNTSEKELFSPIYNVNNQDLRI